MDNYSPNMLKTFETCPQKYWFKYIDNISLPQKSSMFNKGKKIHALAHYYLRGDDISKLEKALSSEEQKIWETLKQNEFFQKSYENSEYNLSCKVGDYWIGGRIDAIVKENSQYYILDYKTGQIPKNPEFDFQTMVYLLCVSKRFGNNLKFIYIDLKNNQNHIIDFSTEKQVQYEEKIINICDTIKSFQPLDEIEHVKKCDFCEYRKICL